MKTAVAHAGSIDLAYDAFGDPADPAMVLVMGLGTQRPAWPEPMCEQLAAAGFYVVRFDNRDIGASTHLSDLPAPGPLAVALRRARASYVLDDLAADTVGLFDALELDRVHLVGASMGGFIAQLVAISAPQRVASLALMMTSTGSRLVGRAKLPVAVQLLRRPPATTREQVVAASVSTFRLIGSPGFPFAEDRMREYAGTAWERGYDPAGARRQLAAVLAQTNRTSRLRMLTMPTVVLHGLSDPLVDSSGGLALARAIPRARFVGYSGMGHDLPAELWPEFAREIVDNARRPAGGLSAGG